jgi:hypothetical protein
MFFALRLVTSVAASKVVLGTTIVATPLQYAGVALVCAAITGYLGLQLWAARRGPRALAAAAAAAAAADASQRV